MRLQYGLSFRATLRQDGSLVMRLGVIAWLGLHGRGREARLRSLDANLLSAVRPDRVLLPSMIGQRSSVIIHITSGAFWFP